MGGYDFQVFWRAGRALLAGLSPYTVEGFFYPLPAAFFFVLFALFPKTVAFYGWLAFNLTLFFRRLGRRALAWLLYFPMIHFLSSGQLDLFLWLLARSLTRGVPSALAASVITLKPQVAFVVLPHSLVKWLREDRRTLAWFLGFTGLLWGGPTLLAPGWIRAWRAAVPPLNAHSRSNAPGLWSLERLFPNITAVVLVLAVALFLWGLFQKREVAWAAAMLANPSGLFYTTILMMDAAPPWLLVPLSWLAVVLSLLGKHFVPWMLLPLAVLLYHRAHWRKPQWSWHP